MNSANIRGGGMYIESNSIAYVNGDIDNWSRSVGGISMLQSEIKLQGTAMFSSNHAKCMQWRCIRTIRRLICLLVTKILF